MGYLLCIYRFDESSSDADKMNLNCFCEVVAGIQNNDSGYQLKDLIMKNGIVDNAVKYLETHTPKHNK